MNIAWLIVYLISIIAVAVSLYWIIRLAIAHERQQAAEEADDRARVYWERMPDGTVQERTEDQ